MKRWTKMLAAAALMLWATVALGDAKTTGKTSKDTKVPAGVTVVTGAVAAAAAADENDAKTAPVLSKGVIRVGLRKWRRELLKDGEFQKAAAVTRIMWSRDGLEALEDFIAAEVQSDNPQGLPTGWVDQLTLLIEWLLENSDEIIEMILKIIDLFTQLEQQGYTNVHAVVHVDVGTGQMHATVYATPPVRAAA